MTVIYNFGAYSGDTIFPLGSLARDSEGNFYGASNQGGDYGVGTLFKVTPDGTETVLHSFDDISTDGFYPLSGVVFDKAGNLYGATGGGPHSNGIAYEWSASGAYSIIYNFPSAKFNGTNPTGGLTVDSKGNLYGTTTGGGATNNGTVFRLSPEQNGTWRETVLYSFTGTTGSQPGSIVTFDGGGDLYTTTAFGGTGGWGTVVKISPGGIATVLCNFNGIANGAWPQGNVLLGSAGNIYGAASEGGSQDVGVFFKIAP